MRISRFDPNHGNHLSTHTEGFNIRPQLISETHLTPNESKVHSGEIFLSTQSNQPEETGNNSPREKDKAPELPPASITEATHLLGVTPIIKLDSPNIDEAIMQEGTSKAEAERAKQELEETRANLVTEQVRVAQLEHELRELRGNYNFDQYVDEISIIKKLAFKVREQYVYYSRLRDGYTEYTQAGFEDKETEANLAILLQNLGKAIDNLDDACTLFIRSKWSKIRALASEKFDSYTPEKTTDAKEIRNEQIQKKALYPLAITYLEKFCDIASSLKTYYKSLTGETQIDMDEAQEGLISSSLSKPYRKYLRQQLQKDTKWYEDYYLRNEKKAKIIELYYDIEPIKGLFIYPNPNAGFKKLGV